MTKFVTGKVRLSFPKLFKAEVGPSGGDPKYSVQLIIPKADTETLEKFKTAAKAAIESKWPGDKKPAKLKVGDTYYPLAEVLACPLRDGDKEDSSALRGCWFVNVSAKEDRRPGVVGMDNQEILDPAEIYAGCYAKAQLAAYGYDASGSKGIAFGLNNIKKVADGDRLDGRQNATEVDWGDDDAY